MIGELAIQKLEEWSAWLLAHHSTEPGIWLITFKKSRAHYIPVGLAAAQAARFGWRHDRRVRLGDDRVRHLYLRRGAFTPWADEEKALVRQLAYGRLLHRAGLAAVAEARRNGSWWAHEVARLLPPPLDLTLALAEEPSLRDAFDLLQPNDRNAMLAWAASARRMPRRDKLAPLLATLRDVDRDAPPWWTQPSNQTCSMSADPTVETNIQRFTVRALEHAHRTNGVAVIRGLSRRALELLLGLGHSGEPRFSLAVALIGNDEFDADGAAELARTVRGDEVVVRAEFSLADLTPDDVRQFLALKGVHTDVQQRVLAMLADGPLSLRKIAAVAEEAESPAGAENRRRDSQHRKR